MNAISHVFFLFLICLTFSLNSYSQFQPTPVKRSNNQITINGKNFYLHEVLKGQTLFGISKEYKVSEEEIKKLNPDLNKKSVFPGMVLRIPDIGTTAKPSAGKEEIKFFTHTVLPKETFFSISRRYGIKVDEIRELNPEARWGLKTGQIIKIPKDKITISQKNPVTEEKTVKAGIDDSDQGSEKERADRPCRVKPFPHENENFQLAILLPLNITQNDTLSYSDTLKPEHFRFYEFLEGVYLAIDSMRLEGLNLTVEVFDTERNPETIRGIIENDKLKEADLIIGPVFRNEIEIVAAFAKSKHIPMVSPLSTYDVVKSNPYAFQVRNNLPRQIELATNYLGSKYNQNVLVIGQMSEKASPDFIRFLGNLGPQIKEHDPAKKATFKTIYFSETSRNFMNADSQIIRLDSYLSASLPNFIILPSENEVFITEVINELHQKSTTQNIHVFGLNQWVFAHLDLGNLYNVNLELYSDFDYPFVDYTDPLVLNFCRKYKENWNIEPSNYSFQGFDIAYFFTRALFQFGRNLTSSVPCWTEYLNHPSMLTPMRFQSNSNANGFDNHAVTIIRYQKDQLLRKKVN
ncbi:MAG: LysM peptidoglycan-binding domain-containing protein [Bacteroidales bacterium]